MSIHLSEQYIFQRSLTSLGQDGQVQTIHQEELSARARPLVILGDQGMGKTTLLEWLGGEIEQSYFTKATKLVRRPNEVADFPDETVLIIDGLDELAAVGETNPLHNLLEKLPASRVRNFIVSCRSIDWYNERDAEAIRQDSGSSPEIWSLESITKEQATEYFRRSSDLQVDAETLIERLRTAGLSSLFSNPLTLRLVRRLASQPNFEMPHTKADLYRQAAVLLRLDENPTWHNSELNQLSKSAALRGAGAAMASILLTGSEGLTFAASTAEEGGLLRVPDVAELPGGEAVAQIAKSRLFRTSPFDIQCLEPLHRTIAEFLGSTWIAELTQGDPEKKERLLSLLKVEGEIPSSIRGLFAWLALQTEWTDEVIQTDPFGLLRYGDPGSLPTRKLEQLFSALAELEALNPNFRGDDRWQRVGPLGLARQENQESIKRLLASDDTGFQVLTIILESLEGSELVSSLLPELETIALDEKRYYRARYEAAALIAARSSEGALQRRVVTELTTSSSYDSNRLAVELIPDLSSGTVSTEEIAQAVLAHVGLAPHVSVEGRGNSVGSLWLLRKVLSPIEAGEVLDVVVREIDRSHKSDESDDNWSSWYELSSFAIFLINKVIASIDVDAARLWSWLSTLGRRSYGNDDDLNSISEIIKDNDHLRRAIQRIVLFSSSNNAKRSLAFYELRNYTTALWPNDSDVLFHLETFGEFDDLSTNQQDAFSFLVRRVRYEQEYTDELAQLIARIVAKHPVLHEIAYPTPSSAQKKFEKEEKEWERKQEQRRLERLQRVQQHRSDFQEAIEDLREGDLRWTLPCANAFVGRYSDIDNELKPSERVASWLGEDVATAALQGFEATLFKGDLPSSDEVANTYASGKYWNVIRPILAGVAQRWLTDRGFEEIATDVLIAAYYGVRGDLLENDRYLKGIGESIADELSKRVSLKEVEKAWFEPHLQASEKHIIGLFELFNDQRFKGFAVELGLRWLSDFPSMSPECARQIIGSILKSDASFSHKVAEQLAKLAAQKFGLPNLDYEQQRLWLAVLFLFDFDTFNSGWRGGDWTDKDFLWDLRFVSGQSRFDEAIQRPLKAGQIGWIISNFRGLWPRESRESGASSGDRNPWDASDFIQSLINQISNDTSSEAQDVAKSLLSEDDTWAMPLKTAYAQQRRSRIETNYKPPSLDSLVAVFADSEPNAPADVQAALMGAIERAARKIRADNVNSRTLFFTDAGEPRTENECRDRFLNLLDLPYGISATPEELMPNEKRADIGFRLGKVRIPLEAKCQWNRSVWKGVTEQLDQLYSIDHEAHARGVYLVFWFGLDVPSNKRPFPSNVSHVVPETPLQLKKLLEAEVPAGRSDEIRVVVLDLTGGPIRDE